MGQTDPCRRAIRVRIALVRGTDPTRAVDTHGRSNNSGPLDRAVSTHSAATSAMSCGSALARVCGSGSGPVVGVQADEWLMGRCCQLRQIYARLAGLREPARCPASAPMPTQCSVSVVSAGNGGFWLCFRGEKSPIPSRLPVPDSPITRAGWHFTSGGGSR